MFRETLYLSILLFLLLSLVLLIDRNISNMLLLLFMELRVCQLSLPPRALDAARCIALVLALVVPVCDMIDGSERISALGENL